MIKKEIKTGIRVFIAMTVLTGIVYPAAVTVLAQLIFPRQADGSIVSGPAGIPIGSKLIGQPFTGQGYFWSRPSATSGFPYNPMASGGSNLGPTNQKLLDRVRARVRALAATGITAPVPSDLVEGSGSGLDPDISLSGALVQVPRIAQARHIPEAKVYGLVKQYTEGETYIPLTVPMVNVLKLNLALDKLK